MSGTMSGTAADDVQGDERIQSIHVATQYLDRYQSVNHIRDLDPIYLDEPKELGGFNSGATALEMTLAALNSCSAMIMYILKREMKFDLQAVAFETDGWMDSRRIEMRKKKLLYSQVEPIADHFHRVHQKVLLTTTEPAENVDHFRSEVHRLCPMHRLLADANVPVETEWVYGPDISTT